MMEFIEPYMDYIVIAAIAVVALIVLVMISRAFGGRVRGRKGKRLGVSEYRELDQSRRLMLIRRDNVEHLILVGGGQSLVIEQDIGIDDDEDYASPPLQRHQPAPPVVEEEPEYEPEPIHRPAPPAPMAPRAPAFADRAPNVRPVHREAPRFDRPDEY